MKVSSSPLMDPNDEDLTTCRPGTSNWPSWLSTTTKQLAGAIQNEMMSATEDAKLFCEIIMNDSKTWINQDSTDTSRLQHIPQVSNANISSHENAYKALWASEMTYLCDPPQTTNFVCIKNNSNNTTRDTTDVYDEERKKEYDSNPTVQAMYRNLVPSKVSDHDFWSRLFSRMDQLHSTLNKNNFNEEHMETECDEYDISWT